MFILGEITFEELWKLLKILNLQMSEPYVQALFKQVFDNQKDGKYHDGLTENGFFELFRILSDLPEYRSALRLASSTGEENMDAKSLVKFLKEEQHFEDIDEKKAESIIQQFETGDEKRAVLSINGMFIHYWISP